VVEERRDEIEEDNARASCSFWSQSRGPRCGCIGATSGFPGGWN